MRKKLLIIAILTFWQSLLVADNLRFAVKVSKNQVATGEQFQVTYSVNGSASRFSPPDFRGFQLISGPNESSSMTSINGNVSASTSISFDLMAVREGTYTIAPATIVAGGRRLTSGTIRIKVVKGRMVRPSNPGTQSDREEESRITPPKGNLSRLLFIRASVGKSKAYIGEQIPVTYRLYTQVDIVNSELDKLPDLNGFWSEETRNQSQEVEWRTETIKGVRYHVADIKQTILFPQRAGSLTIDPLAMTFRVRQPIAPRDMMEQVFGAYQEVNFKAKSTPVTVRVLPLPDQGKVQGFNGAVGRFSVAVSVDKNELKANESLNYQIKITGSGNLKLIKNPSVGFPSEFESYDPKVTDNVAVGPNGLEGSRVFNYLVIPRREGTYTIPPANFAYFDPSSGRYVEVAAKSFHIKVDKGEASGNISFPGQNKEEVNLNGKDIKYIKKDDPSLRKKGDLFFGSFLYYLLLLLGPLLFAGAWGYRKWNEKLNSDVVKVRNKKANKIATGYLANAKKQLTLGNSEGFYEDVFKGLYGYLGYKLDIAMARTNKDTILGELRNRHVSDSLIGNLSETIDLCEMARFSPVEGISMQQMFDRVNRMINEMEESI